MNDDDDHSAKLIKKIAVRKELVNDTIVYTDHSDTFRLTVTKAKYKAGTLEFLSDGPGSKQVTKLECYKKSKIQFDKK